MRVAILTRREVVTQVMMFVMNMALLLTGALSLVPVAKISQRCFTWALQLAAGSHAVKLFNTTGMLSLRPFPSSPLAWMQRAAEYTDCHYMSLALVFLMGRQGARGILLNLLWHDATSGREG